MSLEVWFRFCKKVTGVDHDLVAAHIVLLWVAFIFIVFFQLYLAKKIQFDVNYLIAEKLNGTRVFAMAYPPPLPY